MSHIPRHKDAWHTRFQIIRLRIDPPALRTTRLALERVLAGDDVALSVPLDYTGEPFGSWNGTRIER